MIRRLTIAIIILITTSILMLSLISCQPPLDWSTLEIKEMKVSLDEVDINGNVVDADVDTVQPGKRYRMLVDVMAYNEEEGADWWIKQSAIRYDLFDIDSENGSFLAYEGHNELNCAYIEATKNSFTFIDGSKFIMTITVDYNDYEGHTQDWDIDWDYDSFIFDGVDGADGAMGFDGANGSDSSTGDAEHGENGDIGGDGQAGEDGVALEYELAYYDITGENINGVTGDRMIVLRDLSDDTVSLFEDKTINITTTGGNGGDGGDGGNGGDGGDYTGDPAEGYVGGNGGNGGNGGQGGKGGDGGDITITYFSGSNNVIDRINADQSGGIGGLGGDSGNGGDAGTPSGSSGYSGSDGDNGYPGSDGSWNATGVTTTDNIFNGLPSSISTKFDKNKIIG